MIKKLPKNVLKVLNTLTKPKGIKVPSNIPRKIATINLGTSPNSSFFIKTSKFKKICY